jgi:hypothetical protein
MLRKALGEESMSHTRVFEWHARFRAGRKRETGKEQNQEHAHNFLWHLAETEASSVYWAQQSRFNLKMVRESSPRKVMF